MRKLTGVLLILAGYLAGPANADVTPVSTSGHWLMLVGTRNLDASREDAFNHWYDDIDIPDVLKVPGYRRARRALREEVPGFSAAGRGAEDGRYVALYDIETSNMDRTIIDMMLAAKKMDMTGRSIDALKVTERTYFRRLGDALEFPGGPGAARGTYLYLERIACCRDEATAATLNDWYESTRLPALAHFRPDGLRRVTRYEVHRVVMVEPREVPRFLAIYEFEAASAAQVVAAMRRLNDQFAKADWTSDLFIETGSDVFRQIRDVARH
jgi:hypothetical protein